jgi:hypothetical protein
MTNTVATPSWFTFRKSVKPSNFECPYISENNFGSSKQRIVPPGYTTNIDIYSNVCIGLTFLEHYSQWPLSFRKFWIKRYSTRTKYNRLPSHKATKPSYKTRWTNGTEYKGFRKAVALCGSALAKESVLHELIYSSLWQLSSKHTTEF